jgi:hypothetical protein
MYQTNINKYITYVSPIPPLASGALVNTSKAPDRGNTFSYLIAANKLLTIRYKRISQLRCPTASYGRNIILKNTNPLSIFSRKVNVYSYWCWR